MGSASQGNAGAFAGMPADGAMEAVADAASESAAGE